MEATVVLVLVGFVVFLVIWAVGAFCATKKAGREVSSLVRTVKTRRAHEIVCSRCQAAFPTSLTFQCDQCGRTHTRNIASKCPDCGYKARAATCPQCGADILFG